MKTSLSNNSLKLSIESQMRDSLELKILREKDLNLIPIYDDKHLTFQINFKNIL